ncbi:unnamed protein product [Anisakis simplex]|uniref:Uncharacterized protein n=1 Tax=Anisakis simplex TaxID=6269 RepID=A0A3P6PB93_ANISI|nr:unnamed protein product [Anisakis simplex]
MYRSANGQFELFLLTSEGSSHSDGSTGLPLKAARHHLVPGPAPALYPVGTVAYRQAVQQFDQSISVISTDSESMISDMRGLPIHMKNAAAMGRRTYQQQYLMPQGWLRLQILFIICSVIDILSEFRWLI